MAEKPNIEALYHQIGGLLASAPDLTDYDDEWNLPASTMEWLGRASAVVHLAASPTSLDGTKFDIAAEAVVKTLQPSSNARQIILILNRVMATLEAQLPAASRGAFVSAGDEFDAFSALAKLLDEATSDVLIIDPYMDASMLTDFAGLVREGVTLRLLTDEATCKPSLKPAAQRWIGQHGGIRPTAVRVAPARSLHDRLIIIDQTTAWILTQSLKDFAKRAHASIQRADTELARMKVDAFTAIWDAAPILIETS